MKENNREDSLTGIKLQENPIQRDPITLLPRIIINRANFTKQISLVINPRISDCRKSQSIKLLLHLENQIKRIV